jgi:hypothetical protein
MAALHSSLSSFNQRMHLIFYIQQARSKKKKTWQQWGVTPI